MSARPVSCQPISGDAVTAGFIDQYEVLVPRSGNVLLRRDNSVAVVHEEIGGDRRGDEGGTNPGDQFLRRVVVLLDLVVQLERAGRVGEKYVVTIGLGVGEDRVRRVGDLDQVREVDQCRIGQRGLN